MVPELNGRKVVLAALSRWARASMRKDGFVLLSAIWSILYLRVVIDSHRLITMQLPPATLSASTDKEYLYSGL